MRLVKTLRDRFGRIGVIDRQFETLSAIAGVVLSPEGNRLPSHSLLDQRGPRTFLALLEPSLQRALIYFAGRPKHGKDVAGVEVCLQQTACGEKPRMLRDDDARNPDLIGHRAGMQRPRASEGDQRELTRIQAALDRDNPLHFRHCVID
jgi:hypothetical protein